LVGAGTVDRQLRGLGRLARRWRLLTDRPVRLDHDAQGAATYDFNLAIEARALDGALGNVKLTT
jgi:hypothetical protein